MYLKNVTIQGFKSFPDKINVNFTDGLTAIVGPNGSGKSNICDAIRWVLGEQSTKTLRGSKMEDVIFNGTTRRAATGYAEVTLVLNNETRIVGSDYDEVAVTRRYYRSGESEYYINRQPVRLKDIHELFMDTGLGRDGYSIIGQGRIAEILSQKGEDRRQVFEEAAGISKYRYRKTESERKLVSAEENLARVQDIILQLEERVGPLKIASEKAQKFLHLRDRLKELEVDLWMHQIDESKTNVEKLTNDVQTAEVALVQQNELCDGLEQSVERGYEEVRGCEAAIDRSKNAVFAADQAVTENQGKIAAQQATIQAAEDAIRRFELEIEYGKNSHEELEERIAEAQNQRVAMQAEQAETEQRLAEHLKKDDVLLRFLTDKSNEMEQANEALKADMAKRADNRINLSARNAQIVSAQERMQQLETDGASREKELSDLQRREEESGRRAAEEKEKSEALQNSIIGYGKMSELKQAELNKLMEQYRATERLQADSATRYKMLSDMQRDYEGYARSVKLVMQEAKRGRLSGVHGPVSSLLKTENRYIAAIEVALGGAAQNIVVDDEACGKAGIELLKRESAGRATFLPLTAVKGRGFTWKDVERQRGFLGIAADLVTCKKEYAGIAENLLGRTVIVEDMDSAIAIAKAYHYAFRIVTLDGQVMNAGGSMTGGSMNKTAGVFSRGAEITVLEKKLQQYETELAALKKSGDAARQAYESAAFELQKAQGEQQAQSETVVKLEYEHQAVVDELARQREMQNGEQSEQKLLQQRIDTCTAEIDEMQREIDLLTGRITESEELVGQLTMNREEFIKQREELNHVIVDLKIEINTKQKDAQALETSIEEYRSQMTSGAESGQEKQRQIDLKQEEIVACRGKIETLTTEIAALKSAAEAGREEIKAIGDTRTAHEKHITEDQQKQKEARAKLSSLEREHVRLQNMLENAVNVQDTIINRMWESYEMTLTEAMAAAKPVENAAAVTNEVSELKNSIKRLGNINIDAIEEYREVSEKYEFLTTQRDDLNEAKAGLNVVIDDLTKNMREIFREQFELINQQFKKSFVEMFGGGSGELLLEDPENVLESGIEIRVQPPGKKVKSISLLSGGEQAFVAIALIFAILRVRPTPFCVFDEIEAALDDVNVGRYADYLKKGDSRTQYIVVTHRRGTMEAADMLYGVTMQERGVSKLLAINVSEVEQKLHLKAN